MPTISEFYGITIMMYYEDHDPPHFNARHARFKAKFAIADLAALSSKGVEKKSMPSPLASSLSFGCQSQGV